MSVHASSWAWQQPVGDFGAKLVLLKLADQANDDGECWPAQRTIADDCEMSRRTVQRKLDELKQAGLIDVELPEEHGRNFDSNLYRVKCVNVTQGGRQADAGGASSGDAGGASLVTHRTVIEPSLKKTGVATPEPRHGSARFLCPEPGCQRAHFAADDLQAHLEIDHGRAA